MQKVIKWSFLFLLIALPVSIYVFLQTFGENKFKIPVYYENGISDPSIGCSLLKGQHFVPYIDASDEETNKEIVIFNVGGVNEALKIQKSNNLLMLYDKLDDWENVEYQDITFGSEELLNFARCGLNLKNIDLLDSIILNDTLVLVDSERRIRGYYGVLDRVEVDRLITEVNILMTETE